jgi:hypothetical protein
MRNLTTVFAEKRVDRMASQNPGVTRRWEVVPEKVKPTELAEDMTVALGGDQVCVQSLG